MQHRPTLTSGAEPLTTIQRMQVRDLLSLRWREQVKLVTDLAVRRHSIDDADPMHTALVNVLDTQLAATRRMLVDIETALKRLDSGSYGRCDGCELRIPFEQLELRPATRFCTRCGP
jgi:RNA polymerase-binding transcription factor DksA